MRNSEFLWAKETLEYTDAWVELGILTAEITRRQLREWSKDGADQNTEHYRHGAWQTYWEVQNSITDHNLEKCISLAVSDADTGMGAAILHDMLKADWLSDKQFKTLSQHDNDPSIRKIIARQTKIRSLRKNHSHAHLYSIVRDGDSFVQRHVIDHYHPDQATLKFLEEYGLSRAVRNIARTKIRQAKSLD